jgi:hypothetical protein
MWRSERFQSPYRESNSDHTVKSSCHSYCLNYYVSLPNYQSKLTCKHLFYKKLKLSNVEKNRIKIFTYLCLIKEYVINVVQSQIWSYIKVISTMLHCTEVYVHSRPWMNDHQQTLAYYADRHFFTIEGHSLEIFCSCNSAGRHKKQPSPSIAMLFTSTKWLPLIDTSRTDWASKDDEKRSCR